MFAYPKYRHHPTHPSKLVRSPEQEAEFTPRADGWTDSLAEARAVAAAMPVDEPPVKSRRRRADG